jgi:site-specific DNA-cytosine methylase
MFQTIFRKALSGGISRCVKAEKHDLGVVLMNEVRIGNIYGFDGGNYAGNVYDKNNCSPTIRTYQGGNQQPCIVAMRGRNPDNPSGRSVSSPTEQRLEANTQGTSNYLTSVQKDNLLLEKPSLLGGIGKENEFGSQYRQGNRVYSSDACAMALNSQPVGNAGGNSYLYIVGYRIRKLTPRECGRLMGVSDEDISKMAAVNSNTQLYKQFGNSIVVDVMCAMFKNLNINQGDTV